MDTLLVAGIDTTVGANLAVTLADRFRVVGMCRQRPISLRGVETVDGLATSPRRVREAATSVQPSRIVHCGAAAESCWTDGAAQFTTASEVAVARAWAEAADAAGCPLTFISSDGVFTGPWIFHDEDSDSFCRSKQARAILDMEQAVIEACSAALVVRTNAYGWSPFGEDGGWIEQLLDDLEAETAVTSDFIRHASPIPATSLANVIAQAWEHDAHGIMHIAGSERISPMMFVERLASEFNLPMPRFRHRKAGEHTHDVFGGSETSLRTVRIRRLLGLPLPNVAEGIAQLARQEENGFRSTLTSAFDGRLQKVA